MDKKLISELSTCLAMISLGIVFGVSINLLVIWIIKLLFNV